MLLSQKKRVGILRGGPSSEYEASLDTGSVVLGNLPEDIEAVDILIDRDGLWHEDGIVRTPEKILSRVDLAWNALHGEYGEDGKVQKILDYLRVPYTGSGAVASSVGMNKILSKKVFEKNNIKTPHYIVVERLEDYKDTLPFPLMVKPSSSGSGLGVSKVFDKRALASALELALMHSRAALVEEFIGGPEVFSGVVENFRNVPHYPLLPSAKISREQSEQIQDLAVRLHHTLGLKDYSGMDFVAHPTRGIFVLEVNTLPKLSDSSPFVNSLKSAGASIKEFVAHILSGIK